VIFAAMHVAHNDCKNDTDRLSRWKFVESAIPYFNMAIDALQNLDRGNRSVERCVSYLSQLTIVPLVSCELSQYILSDHRYKRKLTRTKALVDDSTTSYNQHLLTRDSNTPAIVGALTAGGPSTGRAMGSVIALTRQVPVETDLDEFMLDTDLDFFGRYFDLNHQY
jgi:hypothetical protein